MPDYRKLHNGHGNSQKLAALTDYEFRVWNQYRASADDFGVCPFLPAKIQGDNRRLATDAPGKVLKAMKRLIEVELVIPFAHQGQMFICSPNWQDFEDIKYPRRSLNPVPTADVAAICSELTRNLFEKSESHFSFSLSTRAGTRETQTLTQTERETQTETLPPESEKSPSMWDRVVEAFDGSDYSRLIWLKPCRQIGTYPDRIIVGTPTDLHSEWIVKHFTRGLAEAAARVIPGETPRLTFERIGSFRRVS